MNDGTAQHREYTPSIITIRDSGAIFTQSGTGSCRSLLYAGRRIVLLSSAERKRRRSCRSAPASSVLGRPFKSLRVQGRPRWSTAGSAERYELGKLYPSMPTHRMYEPPQRTSPAAQSSCANVDFPAAAGPTIPTSTRPPVYNVARTGKASQVQARGRWQVPSGATFIMGEYRMYCQLYHALHLYDIILLVSYSVRWY